MLTVEQKLRKLYEDIIAKDKIEIHLKNIDRLIINKEETLKSTRVELEREEADIIKLESKSLYSIFKTILGDKKQELEKERQEYLQVYLKKQSIKAALKELKKEKELLLQSYSGKFGVARQFDELVKKQKAIIQKRNPEMGQIIIHFEERIANHRSKIKELHQAVREGRKAIKILQDIHLLLQDVEIWGKSLKRNVIGKRNRTKDKIQHGIHRVNRHLQRFEKELLDLVDHYEHDYTPQIHEIEHFVNHIIDSLITDWVVKKNIVHSINTVTNLQDKITRIIGMLENDIERTKEYIAVERKDQRALIAGSKG